MGEHTPGPWVAVGAGVYSESNDPFLEIIFSAHNTRSASRETAKANARLIAAAPEMLRRLKNRVVDCDRVGGLDWPTDSRCEACSGDMAAIAKAEGE